MPKTLYGCITLNYFTAALKRTICALQNTVLYTQNNYFLKFFFVYFFKDRSILCFWRTIVLLWGHWHPCFGILVMSPLGFKARVDSALFALSGGVCYTFPEIHLWYYTLPTSCRPLCPGQLFKV